MTMDERRPEERVVHVDFAQGNLGNQMLQYMAAIALARRIGGCVLSGVQIPEWKIDIPEIHQSNPRTLRISSPVTKKLDMDAIAKDVWSGAFNRVELNIYSSHIGNLLEAAEYRDCFPFDDKAAGFDAETLLIHIRGGDILRAEHAQYPVLPIEFYAYLIEATKLAPVFIGQLGGSSSYLDRLKRAFPTARFVYGSNRISDFNTIRASRNIVTSVSTFAWLAAWLSNADQVIMPLSVFCNPLQYPQADLMPVNDGRYSYHLFPVNHAVPEERIEETHRAMIGKWRKVTWAEVHA